jgi:hypothetical protein
LVRANGAVQVGAGVLLATGRLPRLASLALIGSIVPTTYAGHRFWEETDDADRAQQRVHFLKNLGLLGGLVLAAVDSEGQPSLSWRAKRRSRRVAMSVAQRRAATNALATEAVADAARIGSQAARLARRHPPGHRPAAPMFRRRAGSGLVIAHKVGEGAASAARRAGSATATAAHEVTPAITGAVRTGSGLAEPYVASGADLAAGILSKVGAHTPLSS